MSTKRAKLAADDRSAEAPNPGAALRTLRRQRGWTLADICSRTGLPVSTLSKIENGKMSLSFDKITRIAQGLEVDISELFSPQAAPTPEHIGGRRSITRAGDGHIVESQHFHHVYPAAELLNKRIVPVIAEVRARTLEEFGELVRHAGEEFALVLEGTIELHTELYAPTRLEAGDSIYFDSNMGHAYLAASPGRCRLLSVCAAADALLRDALPACRPMQVGSRQALHRVSEHG